MKLSALFFLVVALFGYISCVSRSLPDERFQQSAMLSAPTSLVSLGDPNNFKFAVVGDLHIAGGDVTRLNNILSSANAAGDDFIFFLGDITDKAELVDFQAYKTAITGVTWNGKAFSMVGNHDIFYDGWEKFRTQLGPSNYTLNIGNSKFIVLDAGDGTIGWSQTQWLKGILAQSPPTNIFILSHYLPFVPNVQTYLKLSNEFEAQKLMKIASLNRVSAWFGAHYHGYANGKVEGVDYVAAGGGGGRRMDSNGYFYVEVQVSGSNLTYTLKSVP